MSALQQQIVDRIGGTESASEFALQMIQLPYRQVYGPVEDVSFGSVFAPTLSFGDIRQWPGYEPGAAAQARPARPGGGIMSEQVPDGAAAAAAAAPVRVPVSEVTTEAFTTAARTGVATAALATWDTGLARPIRTLVPVDLQALVVPPEAAVPAASVLPQLANPVSDGGDITAAMPPVPPFSPPANRPPGVYLHWAAPNGVTSAQTLTPAPPAPGDDIAASMRPLADRWLVLCVGGGMPRRVRGWVIESERGRRVDLGSWTPTVSPPDDGSSRTPHFPAERLTVMAGGDPAWAAVYDTVEDRFAMYDDLAGLDPADANGPLSYLVCGWWSKDANDPLYVPDLPTFVDTMAKLKWSVPTAAADVAASRDISAARLAAVGFGQAAVARADVVDTAGTTSQAAASFVHPALSAAAGQVMLGQPADHPQLSLLHGSVHRRAAPRAGHRPDPRPRDGGGRGRRQRDRGVRGDHHRRRLRRRPARRQGTAGRGVLPGAHQPPGRARRARRARPGQPRGRVQGAAGRQRPHRLADDRRPARRRGRHRSRATSTRCTRRRWRATPPGRPGLRR